MYVHFINSTYNNFNVCTFYYILMYVHFILCMYILMNIHFILLSIIIIDLYYYDYHIFYYNIYENKLKY